MQHFRPINLLAGCADIDAAITAGLSHSEVLRPYTRTSKVTQEGVGLVTHAMNILKRIITNEAFTFLHDETHDGRNAYTYRIKDVAYGRNCVVLGKLTPDIEVIALSEVIAHLARDLFQQDVIKMLRRVVTGCALTGSEVGETSYSDVMAFNMMQIGMYGVLQEMQAKSPDKTLDCIMDAVTSHNYNIYESVTFRRWFVTRMSSAFTMGADYIGVFSSYEEEADSSITGLLPNMPCKKLEVVHSYSESDESPLPVDDIGCVKSVKKLWDLVVERALESVSLDSEFEVLWNFFRYSSLERISVDDVPDSIDLIKKLLFWMNDGYANGTYQLRNFEPFSEIDVGKVEMLVSNSGHRMNVEEYNYSGSHDVKFIDVNVTISIAGGIAPYNLNFELHLNQATQTRNSILLGLAGLFNHLLKEHDAL